jgi:hypothetical protein
MPNVTITLVHPIEGPDGQIKQIILREPRWPDVMRLGEPAAYARSDGGMIYSAEKDDVVHAYVQRLLVEPKDPALLEQVSLTDTLQLRETIFGFFQNARKAISGEQ